MNKLILGLCTALLATATGCNTASQRFHAADLRTQNEFLIQQHLLECTARGDPFPVFHLGRRDVPEIMAKYPDLKAARAEFEAADAALVAVLMGDAEYRQNKQWWDALPASERKLEDWRSRNAPVYARLKERSSAYRDARARRDEALYRSNRLTVERLLDDARAENRVLPVAWLGDRKISEYIARF